MITYAAKLVLKIKYYLPYILLSGYFVVISLFYFHHTQSFYFEDESEHFGIAWMMKEHGAKLYRDISTIHQPLPILASFMALHWLPTESGYHFIEHVRYSMIVFSFLGSVFLVWRFGDRGLVFSLLFESLRFYVFGYYFLQETLVVYPLAYLVLAGSELVLGKRNRSTILLDSICLPVITFIVLFSHHPSIPLLFMIVPIFMSFSYRKMIGSLLIFFTLCIVLISQLSLPLWYDETVSNALLYFIPFEASLNILSHITFPVRSPSSLSNPLSRMVLIGILSIVFIGWYLHRNKNYSLRKTIFLTLIMYGLLVLSNLRVENTDVLFYKAFHLMPLMSLSVSYIAVVFVLFLDNKTKRFRYFGMVLVGLLLISNFGWALETKDKLYEHQINYSTQLQAAALMRDLGDLDQDRVLVGPLHGFVHIFSGIPFADRQNAHLPWSLNSKALTHEFDENVTHAPPAFVYFTDITNPYFLRIKPLLDTEYINLQSSLEKPTSLYVRHDVLNRGVDIATFEQHHFLAPSEFLK